MASQRGIIGGGSDVNLYGNLRDNNLNSNLGSFSTTNSGNISSIISPTNFVSLSAFAFLFSEICSRTSSIPTRVTDVSQWEERLCRLGKHVGMKAMPLAVTSFTNLGYLNSFSSVTFAGGNVNNGAFRQQNRPLTVEKALDIICKVLWLRWFGTPMDGGLSLDKESDGKYGSDRYGKNKDIYGGSGISGAGSGGVGSSSGNSNNNISFNNPGGNISGGLPQLSKERGTDRYLIIDNEPLVTRYIRMPPDYIGEDGIPTVNFANFVAGVIEGALEACFFQSKVTACHGSGASIASNSLSDINSNVNNDEDSTTKRSCGSNTPYYPDQTIYIIEFEKSVMERERSSKR